MFATVSNYVIAAIVGAVALVIVGYLVHAAPGDGVSFEFWIANPIRYNVLAWAALGALLGSGVYRIAR